MTGPLVNIGDLARPATVLIERVSDAVGGIAKPWQIKRTAKVEAEAKIILAKADMDIRALQRRAVERLINEEAAKQANIEDITAKTLPNLSQDAKPEQLERDWLSYFFDRCRNTSDEEMQSLWAKILAGQTNNPRSFSKRSIELVSAFEKEDAQAFTRFCKVCWFIEGLLCPLVLDLNAPPYQLLEINFGLLSHLETLGLIRFDSFAGFKRTGFQKYGHAFYFGKPTTIEFPNNINDLSMGSVLLTRTGQELAAICGADRWDGFETYVQNYWMEKGLVLSCPLVAKPD